MIEDGRMIRSAIVVGLFLLLFSAVLAHAQPVPNPNFQKHHGEHRYLPPPPTPPKRNPRDPGFPCEVCKNGR